jgi:ubiquinone/menaquinone biosynthesis C-methylase UbiE
MGFYSRVIFPRIIDFVMSNDDMRKVRTAVLADVSGDVFEIGFGTGLNLRHYPESVKKITTADVNPAMGERAQRRIDKYGIEVDCRTLDAESLPLDDESFDSVVCTWTLCSVEDPMKALSELRRILRPQGKFFFVEHGLADDPKVQKWQNRITPWWKIIGDGCRLNRNAREMIQDAHFAFTHLDTYYMDNAPKIAGYLYQGVATKA